MLACCRVLERHLALQAQEAARQMAAQAEATGRASGSGGQSLSHRPSRDQLTLAGATAADAEGGGGGGGYSLALSLPPPPSTAADAMGPHGWSQVGPGHSVRHAKIVERAVSKLLVAAVADMSERVRRTVLAALHDSSGALDEYLADSMRR